MACLCPVCYISFDVCIIYLHKYCLISVGSSQTIYPFFSCLAITYPLCFLFQLTNYSDLPRPELAEGIRGSQFSIDKNIDESTVDQYLGRPDSVYRDLRMLKDPGDYEAIGGDSYLSGFIRGFEVVPYPYIVNVTDLPPEVGSSYVGDTLFTNDGAGNYRANYQESLQILEDLFPKDKNIFLMCGGGGYAGAMKQLLISLGWDADKIYNVGGYWYYEGENNVPVKNTKNTEPTYDFWKVPYHDIDFSTLHKVSRS